MDCLTSFENSLLLDVTSPCTYSADIEPAYNGARRTYAPELCHDFATTFVRCAAGVIAHVKPAALFSFASHKSCSSCVSPICTDSTLRTFLCNATHELSLFGVTLLATSAISGGKVSFVAYRSELVEDILAKPEHREFLATFGHSTESVQTLMKSMRSRIFVFHARKAVFPHEIGLVLGYPLADVQGFMNGQSELFTGAWKVYDNTEETRFRLEQLKNAENHCKLRFYQGESLAQILSSYGNAEKYRVA